MQARDVTQLLRAPDQRGTGRVREEAEYGAPNIDRLTHLDRYAKTIRAWDPEVVPGLLQTPQYSMMVIEASNPRLASMEARRRMLLKSARTRTFLQRTMTLNPSRSWFVMSEAAIVNSFFNMETHALQLRHLLTLMANGNISIQVLPRNKVTPGLAGHFLLYDLERERTESMAADGTSLHRVGYVETVMGAYYSTRMDDLVRLHGIFNEMVAEALTPDSSETFIREVLASWRAARKTASSEPTAESPSSSPATRGTTASAWRRPEPSP